LRPSILTGNKGKEFWVKNLSSKQITDSQRQVLEKGLNFAVTPDALPHSEIVASVEKGLRRLKNQAKVEVTRSRIVQILKNS